MAEVNELFAGWRDYTPTNILLKGFIGGFGGGEAVETRPAAEIPLEAMTAMQNSAMQVIAAKAGNRLPIIAGRDKGLPKAPPSFDPEVLRLRNAEALIKLGRRGRE